MARIAVFSDIHCGKLSRTKVFSVPGEERVDVDEEHEYEKGLVELLEHERPDYFFIAGDLTSVGSPQEFLYCEKEIIELADKISLPYDHIICCTGNHDVDWSTCNLKNAIPSTSSDISNLRKEKYQRLSSHLPLLCLDKMNNKYINGDSPVPFSGVYETDDFIVIMLNTGWLCEPHKKEESKYYSHGRLSEEQLKWFETTASKYVDDSRKRIVLMHHHAFNYKYPIVGLDLSLIAEGAEFVEIAERFGIDLVIHGHRHHPRVKTYLADNGRRPITFFCAGSLAVNADHRLGGEIPNTVHFIDIDKELDYFVLHNYSYTNSDGWYPMKDSTQTPLDNYMKVGKVFSQPERVQQVLAYKEKDYVQLEWNDLPESLQFLRYKEIIHLMKEQLNDTHFISGLFPETVAINRRQ